VFVRYDHESIAVPSNDHTALCHSVKVALFGELHNLFDSLEIEAANLCSMPQIGGPDDHGELPVRAQ
jgi:hypothetical protein